MIRKITAFLVKYPILVNMIMISILVFGIIGFMNMKSSSFPELPADKIFVNVTFPGASPTEVEEGVMLKIEDNLEGIEGIDRITSSSSENYGSITIECFKDYDIDDILSDVKNAVDRISSFPEDAEEPRVYKQAETSRVMTIMLYGEVNLQALKKQAESMRDDFLAFSEISQVEIGGIPSPEISIEISEEALRKYNLTFDEIANRVRFSNQNLTGGRIKTTEEELLIRSNNRKYYADSYKKIVVRAEQNGGVVLLEDVATVIDGFEEIPDQVFFNGKKAVSITIQKTRKENVLTIDEFVKKYCESFNEAEGAFEVSIIDDSTVNLTQRIDILVENGIVGLILILITLTIFVNLRLSFWVALGIPISFAGMFIIISLAGMTINLISLFGMIIVVGILVDDAIVIGENIYKYIELGEDPVEAAIKGTTEMFPAIFTSILTTIIAFTPLFFLEATIGKFIWNIAAAVIAALIFSLIESILILPSHIAHMKQANKDKVFPVRAKIEKVIEFFTMQLYAPTLRFFMKNKWFGFCLPIAGLFLTIGLMRGGLIGFSFFPNIDGDVIPVRITLASGERESKTLEILNRIEKAVWELNEEIKAERTDGLDVILSIKKEIGTTGSAGRGPGRSSSSNSTSGNLGYLQIQLLDNEARNMSSFLFANRIKEKVGEIPEAIESTFGQEAIFGKPVSVSILGNDYNELQKAKELVREELSQFTSLKNISDNSKPGAKEVKVQLKPLAYNLGLTSGAVARQVRQGFLGQEIQRIQRGRDELKIWVRFGEEDRQKIETLEKMRINTPSGGEVPFSEIATYTLERGIVSIGHIDKMREIKVEAELTNPNEELPPILNSIEETVFPKILSQTQGLKIRFEGQTREQAKIQKSAQKAFPLALITIVLIIITVFRSSLQAGIIFVMIPLGIIGAILGHGIHDVPVNILSFFGIIALTGIVINDAIVFVDVINRNLRNGMQLFDAIFEGGIARLRPILLTTLTTVSGLAPLILEKSLQAQFLIPMAISIAYGLLIGTILILIEIPVLFLIINRIRQAWFWVLNGEWPKPEEVEPAVKELAFEKAHKGGTNV